MTNQEGLGGPSPEEMGLKKEDVEMNSERYGKMKSELAEAMFEFLSFHVSPNPGEGEIKVEDNEKPQEQEARKKAWEKLEELRHFEKEVLGLNEDSQDIKESLEDLEAYK